MSAAEQHARLGLPVSWRHPIRKISMRLMWPLLRRQVAFNELAAGELEAIRSRVEDALTGHHSSLVRHDEVLARFDRERRGFEENVTRQVELLGRQAFARYHEGNGAIRRDLSDAIMHFTELTSDLERNFSNFMHRVDARLVEIEESLASDVIEHRRATSAQVERFSAELAHAQEEFSRALADQRLRLGAIDLFVSSVKRSLPEPPPVSVLSALPTGANVTIGALEDAIAPLGSARRAQYEGYLDELREAISLGPVLVLDPDDALWPELLLASGAKASVLASRPAVEARVAGSGISVEHGELLEQLGAIPPGSLGAVTAFGAFERLDGERLVEVLDRCARALASGGLLFVEGIDPDNVVAASTRLYDGLAPRRPISKRALCFVVGSRGFVDVTTRPVSSSAHPLRPGEHAPWTKDLQQLVDVVNDRLLGPEHYLLKATRP